MHNELTKHKNRSSFSLQLVTFDHERCIFFTNCKGRVKEIAHGVLPNPSLFFLLLFMFFLHISNIASKVNSTPAKFVYVAFALTKFIYVASTPININLPKLILGSKLQIFDASKINLRIEITNIRRKIKGANSPAKT